MRYYTNDEFPFDDIYLSNAYELQGGKSYFSKIRINNDDDILIQFPKCFTKNGLSKTNKYSYINLMFNNYDEKLKDWIDNLKKKIKYLIYQKNEEWFANGISMDDINNNFINFIKKKMKIYFLKY